LLYVGTDDGLIQVSEDGGATWRRAGALPGVPDLAFVNEVEASLHDPDTVYAALDDHKRGDFTPHLVASRDRGRTWASIRGDLPDRHLPWAIAEDPERPGLLFLGTEFGVFFTLDGGRRWIELGGGMPTIAIRDLEIQRRMGDLVAASFGRGFFALDDLTPLREVSAEALERDAILFAPRPTPWYVPSTPLNVRDRGYQGSDYFVAPNPPFGAAFTYYLKEERKTTKESRREAEGELRERGEDTPFPGWEALRAERLEEEPRLLLTVTDLAGNVVRRLEAPGEAGFHRVAWDLRFPPPDPASLEEPGPLPPWAGPPQGPLAAPGRYRVTLERVVEGAVAALGESREFEVVPLENWALAPVDFAEGQVFAQRAADLLRLTQGAAAELERAEEKVDTFEQAALAAPGTSGELRERIRALARDLYAVRERLSGDPVLAALSEPAAPSVVGRLYQISFGSWSTRSGPTATHRRNLEIAETEYTAVSADLRRLLDTEIPAIEQALEAAGAPWTPGRKLPSADQ
ncbi:MAG: glycosyl hydrolase, partial [Thermoanaerobaculia bacterium]